MPRGYVSFFVLFCGIAWCLCLPGCATTVAATEVVVEISADSEVRELMSALRVEVWSAHATLECSEAECWRRRLARDFPKASQAWPVRFPVLPLGGDDTRVFEVIAQALDQEGNVLLDQRAVSSFVPRRTAKVTLAFSQLCIELSDECRAHSECHGPLCSVCREGMCEPTGLFSPGEEGLEHGQWLAEAGAADARMDGGDDGEVEGEDTGAGASDSGSDAGEDAEVGASQCEGDSWDEDHDPRTACVPRRRCVAGQRVTEDGDETTDRVCEGCSSGTFSAQENAARCREWENCATGSYVTNTPGAGADRVCAPCEMGLTSESPNQSSCLPPGSCQAGTQQVTPGTAMTMPVCNACSDGQYCAGGTAPPVPCADDTWDDDANAATVCTDRSRCAAGNYVAQDGNATMDRRCAPCGSGSYSTQLNAPRCAAWTACVPGFEEGSPGSRTADRTCVPAPWTRQFGTPSDDNAAAVSVDGNGNVYVASRENLRGVLGAMQNADAIVRKYDAAGAELAKRQIQITPGTEIASLRVDGSESLYIAGENLPNQPSRSWMPAFVGKYGSAVAPLWTREYGLLAGSVALDGGGNVYIAGTLMGQAADAYVRKFDGAGGELWTRQFGNSDSESGDAVGVDGSGNVYVAGATSGVLPGQIAVGEGDGFIRKYNDAGSVLWTWQFGTSSNDSVASLTVDQSGNVYVAGTTSGVFPGQTSAGGTDAFVRGYRSTGDEIWTRQFGTSGSDSASSVGVDRSGNVYVAGSTDGAFPGQSNAGGTDVFVRGYRSAGTALWTRQFGSDASENGHSVAVDDIGNVYVAGRTFGTLPGQASAGGSDAFVVKLVP